MPSKRYCSVKEKCAVLTSVLLAGEISDSDHTCRRSQLRGCDSGQRPVTGSDDLMSHGIPRPIQVQIRVLGHPATDHDELRVEHICHHGQPLPEPLTEVLHDSYPQRIALPSCCGDLLAGGIFWQGGVILAAQLCAGVRQSGSGSVAL